MSHINQVHQLNHLHLALNELYARVVALEQQQQPNVAPTVTPAIAASAVTQDDLRALETRLREHLSTAVSSDIRVGISKEATLFSGKVEGLVGKLVRARVEQLASSVRDEVSNRFEELSAASALPATVNETLSPPPTPTPTPASTPPVQETLEQSGLEIDISDMELTTAAAVAKRGSRPKKASTSVAA
jgi:hypothetical protein